MRPNPSTHAALWALHGAVLLFGFSGLFGKWLALTPVAIVLGRTAIAALALGAVRLAATERAPAFDARLIGNGALLALHWLSFFAAIQVANVAIGMLGYASFPLFVLVLERVLLHRRWSAREGLTAALVTAGLVLLVPDFSLANRTMQGLLWALLSGFTFALLAVLNRHWAANRPATDIAFWQNLWAALVLLPVAGIAGDLAPLSARDAGLLALLGLVCTAFAHTLFIRALTRVSTHTASVIAALEPLYGIVLAALLLDEIPDLRTIGGGALIVGAAIIATRRAA